jgi:hypothetical protein
VLHEFGFRTKDGSKDSLCDKKNQKLKPLSYYRGGVLCIDELVEIPESLQGYYQ